LVAEHQACSQAFERLAHWLQNNKAKYERVPLMNGTISSIIGDLEKKDWRDILGIRYDKNSYSELNVDQRAELLIELHLRVN